MTANDLKIDIDIKDIDLVKNLVELLEKYIDVLPQELKNSLYQISGTGLNDFIADDLHNMYPDFDGKKYECSENKVISINKILGKVVVYDNGEKILYPLNFYLKYDGKTIIEWGNND